ncbi:hypothetical protein PLESTM_000521000 [Pleodorina starrii]|nr:hypothetical protein PLESTM_000521000 [Pleodorina starrii]
MDKDKVRRVIVPPRPVCLNVNAEVPTPFVVPWSWYIKQRVHWPLPKLLTVTVTADGKQDETRYGALVQEDKQFGLRVNFNQTAALDKYAGYHLVSVGKIGQTQLHYTLSRSACPCRGSANTCSDRNPSSSTAAATGAAEGIADQAPVAAVAAAVATAGPHVAGSGHQAIALQPHRGGPALRVRVGSASASEGPAGCAAAAPTAAAAAEAAARRSGGGASGAAASTQSTAAGTGRGTAGGSSGTAAAAAAGGTLQRAASGCGGRRRGRSGGDGRRRSGASGTSNGGGAGDSSSCSDDEETSLSEEEEAGCRRGPIPNNPFRKGCCSCPCHVWRKYWPNPDDSQKHQEELALVERGGGGGRGRGRGRANSSQPLSRSVDTDEDGALGGGGGRGRKRTASPEAAEAAARARPRARGGAGGPPPLPRRPPARAPAAAVDATAARLSGEHRGPGAALSDGSAGAQVPGSGPAALRQQRQSRSGAGAALPPAAAAAPLGAAQPLRTGRQEAERQGVQQQPPPLHQAQEQALPAQTQQASPLPQKQQQQQQQQNPQPGCSTADSDYGGSGGGAAADGGLLAQGPPGEHVSLDEGEGRQAGSQDDGAHHTVESPPPRVLLQQQRQKEQQMERQGEQRQHSAGTRAAEGGAGGQPGVGANASLATLSLSPESQGLAEAPVTDATAAAGRVAAEQPPRHDPQRGVEGKFLLSAAEHAKLRRRAAHVHAPSPLGRAAAIAIVAKARRRRITTATAAATASGSASPIPPSAAGCRAEGQRQQLNETAPETQGPAPNLMGGRRPDDPGRAAGAPAAAAPPPPAAAAAAVAAPGGSPRHPSESISCQTAARPRHKRPREEEEKELPGAAAGAAEPRHGPDDGSAPRPLGQGQASNHPLHSDAAAQQQPEQIQAQVLPAGQARDVPAAATDGAAAAGGPGDPAPPLVLAPPGRLICRPAWDVRPLECDAMRPHVGAIISGPELSVDRKVLRDSSGWKRCFLRLFVERDGFVDGHTAAQCVEVEGAGRIVTFRKVPSHAHGCVFLGWGLMPGGSLVMRVQTAPLGSAAAAAAAGPAGAMEPPPPPPPESAAVVRDLERQRQWSRAATAGSAISAALDKWRQSKCNDGTFRSPAMGEAAAARRSGSAGAGGPLGASLGSTRPRKCKRVGELVKCAPNLPSQLQAAGPLASRGGAGGGRSGGGAGAEAEAV